MTAIKIEGVTHWSIPVNDLTESEEFYHDILGLEHKGRLPGGNMTCFYVEGNNILLAQRREPVHGRSTVDAPLHHSFTVDPACFEDSVRLLHDKGVPIDSLVYRERGFFTGREVYFNDPSGNRLELRDPTWVPGMPKPPLEEIVAKAAATTG